MKIVKGRANTSHHTKEKGCRPMKEKVPKNAKMPPVYPGWRMMAYGPL
jgi:hypothetical protein